MTVMSVGSLAVYVLIGDILVLVLWLGAVDAPLVGILIFAYGYLARRYIPRCYRSSMVWGVPMLLVVIVYIAIGLCYAVEKLSASL